MSYIRQLKKYPIIAVFFVFLILLTLVDVFTPDQDTSQLENRSLAQSPTFSLNALVNNVWTREYGEYIRDQFWMRDSWVRLYGLMETAQGKLEAGGVWLAADGYQIAKNDSWTPNQQTLFPYNTTAVAQLATRWPGRVQAMVIPSPANVMGERLRWSPYQIDENGLMDGMFAEMAAAGAGVIDLRTAFNTADDAGTQVFYRTDHHWTTEGGALLAYNAYCEATGQKAAPPPEALRVEVPQFYGTNYAKTMQVGTVADTLVYYDLPNPMTADIFNAATGSYESYTGGIMNYEKLDTFDKYAAFLHGNNRFSTIEGSGEGSVLVFKDSYGNSLVPYLLANYARVDVMDLRAWDRSRTLDEVIEAGGYDDILVLYSFAAFSEDTGVRYMADDYQG